MDNLKLSKELPIGFMDSGLGGLSVLREAVHLMPNEDFIYYGDSANAPYGTKPPELIRTLTFNVVEKLLKRGIKGLAVACNTATSAAVRPLREKYPELPIVGIEPAVKPAAVYNHGGRVIVMATPMTIRQPKFHHLLDKYKDMAEIVSVECKGLMEYVEHGELHSAELNMYFEEHLRPYLTDDTETIVLGCTHYPFLRPQLREFLHNDNIKLIDGSRGTSMELMRQLKEKDLLQDDTHKGSITIENSSPDPEMVKLSYKLLNS